MEYRDINTIKPYPKNAKKHPKKQIDQVAKSIKEFGFNQPIVVGKDGVIIVGHGRYEAAKQLKWDKVPVLERDLSEEKANAYRLADNKLNESAWDMGLVIEELGELPENLAELTGFDLDRLINDDGEIYTKKIVPPTYEPQGEKPLLGDLYDDVRTKEMIEKIENSKLDPSSKEFLKLAAYRLTVFNYAKVADYYAHEDGEMKKLIEDLALVIVDFDDAVKNGYVKLCDELFDILEKE